MWHLSKFSMHEELPLIKKLMVHTLNQQVIYFKLKMTLEEIQSKTENN